MPIYEFYCSHCHTIFNFLSRSINTNKNPACPKCKKSNMQRRVSMFAVTGKATEDKGIDDLPIDESKIGKAMEALASQAENINENDPRQAAKLMRKLSDMTGLQYGEGMENALQRLEAGEDPEKIEKEMGDSLEHEDPFIMPDKKARASSKSRPPKRDDTLYEM